MFLLLFLPVGIPVWWLHPAEQQLHPPSFSLRPWQWIINISAVQITWSNDSDWGFLHSGRAKLFLHSFPRPFLLQQTGMASRLGSVRVVLKWGTKNGEIGNRKRRNTETIVLFPSQRYRVNCNIRLSRFWCMISVVEMLNPGNRDERVARAFRKGG